MLHTDNDKAMTHKAKYVLNRAYLSESFDQALKYASKWQKIELVIGGALIALGFALWLYSNRELIFPWALAGLGVFEIFSSRIRKYFWLKRQLAGKNAGSEITLTFDDRGIQSEAKFSTGTVLWAGIEKLIETPKGLLIWPQKGVYWYLPKSGLGDEATAFIKQKASTAKTS